MSLHRKNGSLWETAATPYIRRDGVWVIPQEVYIKEGGVWKKAWPDGPYVGALFPQGGMLSYGEIIFTVRADGTASIVGTVGSGGQPIQDNISFNPSHLNPTSASWQWAQGINPAEYEIRLHINTNTTFDLGSPSGQWLPLSTTREWKLFNTEVVSFQIQLRRISDQVMLWNGPDAAAPGGAQSITLTNGVPGYRTPPPTGTIIAADRSINGGSAGDYRLGHDGYIYSVRSSNTGASEEGQWISPLSGMNQYQVRVTNAGDAINVSSGLGVWLTLGGGTLFWGYDHGNQINYHDSTLTLEFRRVSDQVIVKTIQVSIAGGLA